MVFLSSKTTENVPGFWPRLFWRSAIKDPDLATHLGGIDVSKMSSHVFSNGQIWCSYPVITDIFYPCLSASTHLVHIG